MPAQLVPVPAATRCLQLVMAEVNATCPVSLGEAELVFLAELPPVGYNAYFVQARKGGRKRLLGICPAFTRSAGRAGGFHGDNARVQGLGR